MMTNLCKLVKKMEGSLQFTSGRFEELRGSVQLMNDKMDDHLSAMEERVDGYR